MLRHMRGVKDAAAALCDLPEGTPQDFGWRRAGWTRELPARALEEKMGMSFSLPTVTRLLQKVGARKGRPRPTVGCPWSKRKRQAHLRKLRALGLGSCQTAFLPTRSTSCPGRAASVSETRHPQQAGAFHPAPGLDAASVGGLDPSEVDAR